MHSFWAHQAMMGPPNACLEKICEFLKQDFSQALA